ncbi:MAG: hypothetical protein KC553_03820 [Nitrospina sp.]|nr:hypothetical protein [Nitrospina sp.]
MRPLPPNVRPLGDFQTADVWQTHVNAIFYGIQGPGIHDHFQTFVSRDHRLAHALADRFFDHAKSAASTGPLHVMEWGVGNGNLAGSFLSRLKALDSGETVYPQLTYSLCDFSDEILKGARLHPKLQEHADRTRFVAMNAETDAPVQQDPVHQIISNEIWDDLATRVVVKLNGEFLEEYLQPCIDPARCPLPFAEFETCFQERRLDELKADPGFLEHIHWERSLRKTEIGDWPEAPAIETHFQKIDDRIPVPVNTGAFQTLRQAFDLLAPGSMGYTGFDYGMLGVPELNQVGRPYFKLYGGQYTNMVNFPLLRDVGERVGFSAITLQPQRDFVASDVNEPVISAVDLVQAHPKIRRMEPWDVDLLMIQTLAALNPFYRSPYKQKLDYPPVAGTPKKQRRRLAEAVEQLSKSGVPDTVAYVTRREVENAAASLKKIGYDAGDLDDAFAASPPPVAFAHIQFRK